MSGERSAFHSKSNLVHDVWLCSVVGLFSKFMYNETRTCARWLFIMQALNTTILGSDKF